MIDLHHHQIFLHFPNLVLDCSQTLNRPPIYIRTRFHKENQELCNYSNTIITMSF
ncbi:hypothetical protein Hanom_Chr14g01321181 [Helianthus anomalus]